MSAASVEYIKKKKKKKRNVNAGKLLIQRKNRENRTGKKKCFASLLCIWQKTVIFHIGNHIPTIFCAIFQVIQGIGAYSSDFVPAPQLRGHSTH